MHRNHLNIFKEETRKTLGKTKNRLKICSSFGFSRAAAKKNFMQREEVVTYSSSNTISKNCVVFGCHWIIRIAMVHKLVIMTGE